MHYVCIIVIFFIFSVYKESYIYFISHERSVVKDLLIFSDFYIFETKTMINWTVDE